MAMRAQNRWQHAQDWLNAMDNPQFFSAEAAPPKRHKWAPWLLATAILGLGGIWLYHAAPAPSPSAVAHAYKPA